MKHGCFKIYLLNQLLIPMVLISIYSVTNVTHKSDDIARLCTRKRKENRNKKNMGNRKYGKTIIEQNGDGFTTQVTIKLGKVFLGTNLIKIWPKHPNWIASIFFSC